MTMERDWLDGAAEFKFADGDAGARGEFMGYGSIFGNTDLGGDIVERGAFAATLAKRDASDVAMLWGHDVRQVPIGKWLDMREDDRGLQVRGQLTLDIPQARNVHAALKDGTVKGLSIGYRIPPGGAEMDRGGKVRRIKSVDLFEVSVVTFPMNQRAQVARVKSAAALSVDEIKELEDLLRDAGASGSERKRAVSVFKQWLQRDVGEPDSAPRDEAVAAEIAALLRRNLAIINP
jgi:HK97 family phage prohead protease